MKQWRSSPIALHCGYDWEHVIKPGEPYVAVVLDATHELIRCRECARRNYPNDPQPPTTAGASA